MTNENSNEITNDNPNKKITVKDVIGSSPEEEFLNFDLTEIQSILYNLSSTVAIDIAHAIYLTQQSLRGADVLSEMLSKVIKTVSYLESKLNSVKNKVALEFKEESGRTTMDMKKAASEASPEVEKINIKLSSAKATKSLLEKKYDILIKSHHHYKEIVSSYKRSILGNGSNGAFFNPEDNKESNPDYY